MKCSKSICLLRRNYSNTGPIRYSKSQIWPKRNYSNTEKRKESPNIAISADYCRNLVKTNDYENYLCTLLLNGKQRRYAFALRAFNVEVSKAGQVLSEKHFRKMKLKFWSESVDKCYAPAQCYVSDHPVLRELQLAIEKNGMNKLFLKRLVLSRDRSYNDHIASVKQMEEYAEESFSSLYYLLVELYNVKDLHVDHALSHLGKAQGIATLLRSLPYTRRDEGLKIPQETLMKHGVSQERVIRCSSSDKEVEECVFEIASVAYQHLEKTRALANNIPKNLTPLFLPAVVIERYLERLRRANFKLTDPSLQQRDALLPSLLLWNKLRSRF